LFFIRTNKAVQQRNRFVWFGEWVIGKQSFPQLVKRSGYSERTLKRYFYEYLQNLPVFSVRPSEKVNLLIDGTYFRKDLCLVVYRDNTIKYTQLYRITNGEWYEELSEDLANLLQLGVRIESITCDGHKALLKAIRDICPHVVVQRCLIHIQRMSRIWLTQKPQSTAGQSLRRIVNRLHLVRDNRSCNLWLHELAFWYSQYGDYLEAKSFNIRTKRYWFTHKLVRRAYMTIAKALPDMFHFLGNYDIPKSTNGLESFFGHLKDHLRIHRGLSAQHRRNFIQWYLYFRNNRVFEGIKHTDRK
jgi:hypothetical protein